MSRNTTLNSKIKYLAIFSVLLTSSTVFAASNVVAQSASNLVESNKLKQRKRSRPPVFSGQKVRSEAVVPLGNNQTTITDTVVRYVDENGNLTTGKMWCGMWMRMAT